MVLKILMNLIQIFNNINTRICNKYLSLLKKFTFSKALNLAVVCNYERINYMFMIHASLLS